MNRPKVLQFTSTIGGGGAETMLCNLNEALSQRGYDTVVVSTNSSPGENSRVARIREVSTYHHLETDTLLSLPFLFKLWRLIRRERPDVVHTWMHSSGLVAGTLARLAGVPSVVWAIHSHDLHCEHPRPCRKCRRFGRLLGGASRWIPGAIVSCSRSGAGYHTAEYGYASSKMRCIGNGIDIERFQPRPREEVERFRMNRGIPTDAPVIGMMTRPYPVKDLPTFLRAADLLHRKCPEVHFVICGAQRAELDAEGTSVADAFPAPEQLHFLGFHEDTPAVYSSYDILTVSSVSEAYPMVLIEAMACGTPCVSTDVGDARLMIGPCGGIVPVEAPLPMASAWEHLLSLPGTEKRTLRAAARAQAVKQFRLEACTDAYIRLYEELRSGKPKTSTSCHVLPAPHPPHHHGR